MNGFLTRTINFEVLKNITGLFKFLVLVFSIFTSLNASSQCAIDLLTVNEGCAPFYFEGRINETSGKTVASYNWDYGDGNTYSGLTGSHIYSVGTYTVSIKVKYSDGTECTSSTQVKVYASPSADFSLNSFYQAKQCFYSSNGSKNKFCFIDNSKRSTNGYKITRWNWNFGDGDTSTEQNPCHTYDSGGVYTISITVWDEKGCSNTKTMNNMVTVYPDVNTKFKISGTNSCGQSTYNFINETDTAARFIKRFAWDFGDGSALDTVNWNPKHTYTKDGKFAVSFRIWNELNCYKEFKQTIENTHFNLQVFYKDTICWSVAKSQGVPFYAKEVSGASYWEWSFDDPNSGNWNKTPYSWNANHVFMGGPRNYQVKFTVLHPVCGKKDTCLVMRVKGPAAKILMADPLSPTIIATHNYVPATRMPKSELDKIKNSNNCGPSSIEYSTFTKVSRTVTTYKYCYAQKTDIYDSITYCDGDFQKWVASVDLTPTSSVKLTFTDSVETVKLFRKSDPYPSGAYYYPSKGTKLWPQMHDSNTWTCKVPSLVRFTNHSIKYRLYNALDDNPVAYADSTTADIVRRNPANPGTYPAKIEFGNWPPLIAENGWKDTCKNPGYPFASDSMKYLWIFPDPEGDHCTSTIFNKNWECNFSTLIAPYHYYKSKTPPASGCSSVRLTVTDDVAKCKDSMTMMLLQGPPNPWWERTVFCKMTWEMQNVLTPGIPGWPKYPMYGLRLHSGKKCTGSNDRFRIEFDNTLPSCGAQDYWIVFDSAAAVKQICLAKDPVSGATKKVYDYGFLGANNKNGYPVGGPKSTWTSFPWLGNYWWQQGEEGCKTIGLVLKVGDCYDTAWYHDYICFTKLSPDFVIMKNNSTLIYDSSQSFIGKICHSGSGFSAKPGVTIKLAPHDNSMKNITRFNYSVNRRQFPEGDNYYTLNNPASVIKGFWPDSANANPYNVLEKNASTQPINPNNSLVIDSITAITDTLYDPVDSLVYTYLYNIYGNPTTIEIPYASTLTGKELAELNAKGFTYIPGNDFRSREVSFNCKTNSYLVKTRYLPVQIEKTSYILNLKDSRDDKKHFIPGPDSIPIQDTVNFTLPFPGFYTITSNIENTDGCAASTSYNMIYGHFAKFNVTGGDSIICVGDTVWFDYTVRYWTTNCPPTPGGPAPDGCINGLIDNYNGVLTPWDVKIADNESHRNQLNPGWKKGLNFKAETVAIDFGDGIITTGLNGAKPYHVYTKPGVYDVTLQTTDSNGCVINTKRRNLIKVVGIQPDFAVSPLSDTVLYCRKDVVLKDKTKLLGSEGDDNGKFSYREKVVRFDNNEFKVVDTNIVIDELAAWKWDIGNGGMPIIRTSADSLYIVYKEYGRFSPKLTVFTKNSSQKQCSAEITKQNYLNIKGPEPNFSVEGDTIGCVPFTVKVKVNNRNSDSYEWLKGDNSSQAGNKGDSIVYLTYTTKGKYRITVKQGEKHYDPVSGATRQCFTEWPLPKDEKQFYITVLDTPVKPVIQLSGIDTLSTTAGADNYTWLRDGNVIAGNTSEIHSTQKGFYRVIISKGNCTSDTSDGYMFFPAGIGNENIESKGIYIYPNPASGIVTLENRNLDISSFEILSVTGQIMYVNNKTHGEGKYTLHLNHLPKGLYFVRIKTNEQTYYSRIVLQ